MNETTERFLQEIATRVGYDRVAELYLFPVLRQGGVEGAVAVVAAHPEAPPASAEPVTAAEGAEAAEVVAPDKTAEGTSDPQAVSDVARETGERIGEPAEEDATAADGEGEDEAETTTYEGAAAESTEGTSGEEAPPDGSVADSAEAPIESARESRVRARHVVYTARYRHTIKGPDRGRWAVEVVAEADAPLITVEEVVRGVVRRSGDEFQPERLSGEQFRALVPAPAAAGSAPA